MLLLYENRTLLIYQLPVKGNEESSILNLGQYSMLIKIKIHLAELKVYVLSIYKDKLVDNTLTMTKLTSEIAFKLISHRYINPNKFVIIIATVKVTMVAMLRLKPIRRNVTTNTAAEMIENRIY